MPTAPEPSDRFPASRLVIVGLAVFRLDALLLSPYLGWQDSGEFLAATACLGVSHPSGQPLYHLLGKLFLALPFESPAWRMGLLSAASASLSGVLLLMLSRRVVGLPLAWLLSLCVAWSWTWPWWNQALTVETYALGVLLGLGVLGAITLEEPRRTMMAGWALGLACVYRPTFIFALPILLGHLVPAWSRGTRLIKSAWFVSCWGLGISLPIYLAVRSQALPPILFSDLSRLPDLGKHVLGLTYSKHVGASQGMDILARGGDFLRLAWDGLTPVGALLALLGLGWLLSHWKAAPLVVRGAALWAAADLALVLTVPYPVLQSHQVLWPWVVMALLAAYGLRWLWDKASGSLVVKWTPLILGLFAFFQLANVGPLLGKRSDASAEDYARNLLAVMPPGALYHASSDNDFFPVIGLREGYGLRKDVTVVSPGEERPGQREELAKKIHEGAPVVVARLAPGVFQGLVANPLGPLWRYERAPSCEKTPHRPAAPSAVWGGWELSRFGTPDPVVAAGGILRFRYTWHRGGGALPGERLQAVVLLADEKGEYPLAPGGGWWLHDTHECLNGWFQLSKLNRKVDIAYERVVFVPSAFPPGRYQVLVALQAAGIPQEGQRKAAGEFYGDQAWQADWQGLTHGAYGVVERIAEGTGEEKRFPITGGTARKVGDRFAVVGEVEIAPRAERGR